MKKLGILALLLVVVLVLGSCSGPKTGPTETVKLTITSDKTVDLELGQSYLLTYDTDGTVSVEVSGGSYNADNQKFTATEAGTYTITVTAKADGKNDAVETVTVNYTAPAADKTPLSSSINKAEALIKGDYTSVSWQALESALSAAKTLLNTAGVSEEAITSAVDTLEQAMEDLVTVLDKAVVAEDGNSFTWNTITYKAEDYVNFAAIVAEINALNADEEIDLKSEYLPEINAILEKLDAKVQLNIKSELKNNAAMIVEGFEEYTLTAESEDGVTYSWTVDGTEVATTAEYKFTPAEYKTYEIKCTVANGTNTNTKAITVAFVEADYVVNDNFTSGIKVEDNDVIVTGTYGWGDVEGKKVTLPDLKLTGNFTVYFDLTFTQAVSGQFNVMALFLNNESGENILNWVAVREQDNKLEVAVGGNGDEKPTVDMTAGSVDLNHTMHFMATRTIIDGKSYLYAYLLDDYGNVLVSNTAEGKYKDYTGAVQLGIQAENAQFIVSNVAVGINDQYVNTKVLAEYIATLPTLVESDYTVDSWKTYADAQAAANAAASQAELTEKIAAIEAAKNALVANDVVKVEIAENKDLSFGGKTYVAEQYANIDDIIAEINALNETLNSEYAAKAEAILAKLVTKVTVEITWDGLDAINGKTVFVSALGTYELYANPSEGADVTWYVNGQEVKTGKGFDFAPEYGEYTIACKATKGIYVVEKEVKVGFVDPNWQINFDGVSVENDVISVNQGYGWGENEGKKVTMPNVAVSGDFTVYFDVTFKTTADPAVMAFFFHKADGEFMDEWIAVCQHSNKLEVAVNGNKPQIDMPKDTNALENTIHVMATRQIIDGKSYYKAYILNDAGEIIATNENNNTGEDYTGAIMFGIQSENAQFVVSNIAVKFGDNVMNKVAMQAELDKIGGYIVPNYTEDSWAKVLAAKAQAEAASTQAEVNAATEAIKAALAGLVPAEFEKAQVTANGITYAGRTYDAVDYSNYDAVLAKVNELAALTFRSEYNPEIVKALATLEFKLKFNVTGNLTDGMNAIVKGFADYTLTASSDVEGVTYTWYVNGSKVAEGATFTFTPNAFAKFEIECKAVDSEGAKANNIMSVSFTEADVKTPMTDRVTVNTDGSFTSTTGIGWVDWEGRKVVYDDLVFNGSFAIIMDLTYNSNAAGGAQVATIHLLNADTLSPSFGGDWAYVGYGCICLHENPVRLETNWSGTGKLQSSDGSFEGVAAAMSAVMSQLEVGDTFTVKLTCYKNANNQLQLMYSLWNGSEWINFARDEWAGNFGGGFIVGINIENAGITASNVRYELLEETGSYIAGSVKSRAALSAALVQYENINPAEYVNSAAFVAAYNAAWALMGNNSATADYDAAAKALIEAAQALVKRDVAVTVNGLDKGYANYSGIDKFEAVFADGVNATDVKWTYNFNGEAKEVEGADLALAVGAYTDVKLSFTVGGTAYTYQYQNFNFKDLTLKSNTDKVVVNENGSVTVTDGSGWGQKDQLVVDGVYTQEFEIVFDAKYIQHEGGYRIFCLNLFGEEIQPVFGYRRDDGDNRDNRVQIGFDRPDKAYGYVENDTANANDDYDYIMNNAAKFSIKQRITAEGVIVVDFTVYRADGSVIATASRSWIKWYTSKTDLRFTFENVNLELTNIEVYYN